MAEPHVVILGAGPAGLGAAYRLRKTGRARVTVIERQPVPGGNAGSFELAGLRVDFGSHRLHPSCHPEIMADIRELLGAGLLDRPRHGRIRLRGRWIHFPLRPLDLLLQLDRGFAARALLDAIGKPFRRAATDDSFAGVLAHQLGPAICEEFYLPYARKIWGRPPETLSGIQARRRVSAGSVAKLARKVLSQVPGFRAPGAGRFFYPSRGFGQISEGYAEGATRAGATIRYRSSIAGLRAPPSGGGQWTVEVETQGGGGGGGDPRGCRDEIEADFLWSTIPITALVRLIGGAPAGLIERSGAISYRAMLLIYLELAADRFSEYDAHYFPEEAIRITRLSEPKNYAARADPVGRTVLCAELPCAVDDELWRSSDQSLGELVAADLVRAGIPLSTAPRSVTVRRLPQAYPIYAKGYEGPLEALDRWIDGLPGLLSYGRQGLFAHDNTHHALAMAYAAVECLEPHGFDRRRWAQYREVFATHVVED